jgi:hypothetical protein
VDFKTNFPVDLDSLKTHLSKGHNQYNRELVRQFGILLDKKHEFWEQILFGNIGSDKTISSLCIMALVNNSKILESSLLRLIGVIESLLTELRSENFDELDFITVSDINNVNLE